MLHSKFEYFVSNPRLSRFITACGGSKDRAQHLYEANIKLAESFYSVLNLFEIFLRNRINNELSILFNNPDWILAEKDGFMISRSLAPSNFFLRNQVLTAERRITIRKKPITSGLIISEQSLGFWTSLFDTHHYKLLSGRVIHCFPNKPNNIQRKHINLILNDIRDFRNRVYHNEPICFKGNSINFDKAIRVKNDISDLLNWIDSDLAAYVAKFDNTDYNLQLAKKI